MDSESGEARRETRVKRARRASGWAALPDDIVELILSELDLADHARFSSVCAAWHYAAAAAPAPVHKPLALALSSAPAALISRYLSYFLDRYQAKACHIRFVGAFEGWIAMLFANRGLRRRLFLLSRPSDDLIELPRPRREASLVKLVLSSPPASRCLAAALYYGGALECCRPGDKSWTPLSTSFDGPLCMDITFHAGRLHAIDTTGRLLIFDPALRPQLVKGLPRLRCTAVHLVDLPGVHLIDLPGELRVVVTRKIAEPLFEVFRLEPERPAWVKVLSLGGSMLFLSPYCSLAVSAKDYPEYRPDSIYMMSVQLEKSFFLKGEPAVATVYSLDGKRVGKENAKRSAIFFTLFGY